MRVLVVSQYFWPENFRINELSAELVKRGHDVTVLTGVPNYPDGEVFDAYRKAPEDFATYQGVRVVRVPMLPRHTGGLRLVLNYLSFVLGASLAGPWKLRGQAFDVILTFEPSPITVGIVSGLMRWIKRAPQAFWVLDLWPDTLEAIGVVRSPRLLRGVGWLVSAIYRRCDLVLAQSRSFIPHIRRYVPPDHRVEYFPAWAETVFDSGSATLAPELERRDDKFTVLFAGNIGEAQDFPAILDAAQRLREHRHIRWAIVGDGRMGAWVAEEIRRRELGDAVLMLGRHPLERMPEFFAHADALLVSLKDEPIFAMTIPGKLQSYLAAGIPVLAMLNGEGADTVARGGAGLVCASGDSAALAEQVLAMSEMSPEVRAQYGARGRALCRAQFDRDTLIGQLEQWLSELPTHNRIAGHSV
ncbi:glycosyltransferase family 4 protein [Pandoraea sp. NPDC087047]|uniref:glycosyltransferase family 4 protein n=1 Tax=Pandoraea sp. NPDC087047 TaxID=3364390 RepID=UPI0037FFAE12